MVLNKRGIIKYCSKTELTIGIISFIILVVMFFYVYKGKKDLENNPVYTKGIITNNSNHYRSRRFLNYIFFVDGKEYKGSTGYSPHLQEINIGDTCYVVYKKNDPTNNNLVTLKDKLYIKIDKVE